MEGKVKIIVFCIFFLFLIGDNSQNLFKANQIHIKCYKPVLLKCFAVCLRNYCSVVTNFIFLLALQDVLEVQCGIIQHNENLLWNSFLMLFNNLNEQPNVSVIINFEIKKPSLFKLAVFSSSRWLSLAGFIHKTNQHLIQLNKLFHHMN